MSPCAVRRGELVTLSHDRLTLPELLRHAASLIPDFGGHSSVDVRAELHRRAARHDRWWRRIIGWVIR